MLVIIVLGIVLSTAPLEAAVRARQGIPWFDAMSNALLIIMGCAAFALWGTAVVYSLLRPNGGRSRTLTVVASLRRTSWVGWSTISSSCVAAALPSRERTDLGSAVGGYSLRAAPNIRIGAARSLTVRLAILRSGRSRTLQLLATHQ